MSEAVDSGATQQQPGQDPLKLRNTADGPQLFAPPKATEDSRRGLVLGVAAAVVVLLAVGVLALRGGHGGGAAVNAILPVDAYAGSLPLSEVAMSESTSISGGKSTFVDGKMKNVGGKVVSAATAQVIFRNDEGLSPQVETLPVSLIRTHEPYIDTVPVSAAPLKPGDEREFRLIFEQIPANWNQQTPEIHLVKIVAR